MRLCAYICFLVLSKLIMKIIVLTSTLANCTKKDEIWHEKLREDDKMLILCVTLVLLVGGCTRLKRKGVRTFYRDEEDFLYFK